jgi:3-(3-hydroxy-phenyl)propionate hydroxylase
LVGRIITERNRGLAAMRNHVFRPLSKLPGVDAGLVKMTWIPDARYKEGFFAAAAHRAVGWQIPQPWVADDTGASVRLDDVLGGQWTILHTGALPRGAEHWTAIGVKTIRISDPTLTRWLHRKKATAVVVRPDGFIYAAAEPGQPLAVPPAISPQRIGVSA